MRDHREVGLIVLGGAFRAISDRYGALIVSTSDLELARRRAVEEGGPLAAGERQDRAAERIDTASLEQLEIWSDRVLDAATLEEIFG